MASTDTQKNILARQPWLTAALVLAAVVILLASFRSREEIVPVRAVTAERTTIRSVISTNGKVEPLQAFEAHAPIATTIKKVLAKEGEHVRKGQLILQLDDAEARSQAARALAQLRESQAGVSAIQRGGNGEEVLTLETQLVKARSDRDAAQRNLQSLQRLQEKGAASPGEVKDAENKLQAANADFKLLEQKQTGRYSKPEIEHVDAQKSAARSAYDAAMDVVNKLNVRALFDGVVYTLPFRAGAYVSPGDLLLQEADLSRVQVRAFVDEPDVGRLVPGEEIEVTWDAMPGRIWKGAVSAIPAAVKLRGSRNVGETTCVVDNEDFKLLPNVNVNVVIVVAEHRNVLTIPREAVRQDDSKPYVYEVVNNKLQPRTVETAIADLTKVEITRGIPEKALVVLSSTNSKPLHSGLPVKVVR
jgi:HlyD family secretion protein